MMRAPLLLLLVAGLAGCSFDLPVQDPHMASPPVAWSLSKGLLGDWIDSTSSDTFVVHETWKVLDDSTLEGMGRVLAGADTVFIEALRLERRGDQVIYAALPGGEANGTFTPFTCVGASGDTLSFINPANDFPKRIRYARHAGGWHAVIDEGRTGPQREDRFHFSPR